MRSTTLRCSMLMTMLFLGSAAYADGVCEKGYRDTTAAERSTMMRVLELAKDALPEAPEGWIIGGYETLGVPQNVCTDGDATPIAYGFSRTFNRSDDQALRDEALAAAAASSAGQDVRQAQMDALMAKLQTMGLQLDEAAQKGDMTRVDALNREFEQVQKDFEQLSAGDSDGALLEQAADATMKDRTMSVTVQVNPAVVGHADMQRAVAPAGASSAYRWTESTEGVYTAHRLVLLGAWQPPAEGRIASLRAGTVSPAAAHAIAIDVAADPARLESLFSAIDFSALAASVER